MSDNPLQGTIPVEPEVPDIPGEEIPDRPGHNPEASTMTRFATYWVTTGEINHVGECDISDAEFQPDEAGELVLWPVEEDVNVETHLVSDPLGTPTIALRTELPALVGPFSAPYTVDMTGCRSVTIANQGGYTITVSDPADPPVLIETGYYQIIRNGEFPYVNAQEEININA